LEIILSKNNFSIKTPIRELDDELLKVILYGNEGMEVQQNDNSFRFEGIINFISRHSEESSAPIQRWALSFMNKICCPVCNGTRLKKEAHFFRIDNKHIGDVASLDIKELAIWLGNIENYLTKDQNKIAKEIIK
jgi:excinuclease ABC subunit A